MAANLGSPGFVKLAEDTAVFAMKVYGGTAGNSLDSAFESTVPLAPSDDDPPLAGEEDLPSEEISSVIKLAAQLTTEFDKTRDIQLSDKAIEILDGYLANNLDNDPDRHHVIFALALTLCRRVEIQVSGGSTESITDLHLALSRCLFALRQAINTSPAELEVKMKYLAQLGRACTLWSTVLSSRWPAQDVTALIEQLEEEDKIEEGTGVEKITGFVAAVIRASTLSTAFSVTRDDRYRKRGRAFYRHTLKSMRELLPLDSIINPIKSMDFVSALNALSFVTQGVIPFIVQLMALLMQRLVEVPLSAVLGRRAAALAMDNGFPTQGVEWLEQCLNLVWGQLNLRAPAPLQEIQADPEGRMGQIVLAFLGLCVYVDVAGDSSASIAHPERLAYILFEEWLKCRQEVAKDPNFVDLFKAQKFAHISNAARENPVVLLNMCGEQCDALILYGEGKFEHIRLEGVSETFAANLQASFREGLQASHFRSRSQVQEEYVDIEEYRGSRAAGSKPRSIDDVLSKLWKKVVKPILNKMELKPIEDAEANPPRLTWCPTGPTSFFPLHAAGIYDTKDKGSKTYEYVASSYTPTLSVLADAYDSLSPGGEQTVFKGILAVSQPESDGQSPIPQTVDEVEALISAAGRKIDVKWLNNADATKEAVLKNMRTSTWVHLACHARQFPLNTSESAFLLAGGETLTLADISAHGTAQGELAFLSACQTAAGDFDLSEEGVHLAAGMLVAGYRTVIATTWSVRDQDAPLVARAFYSRLFDDDGHIKRTGSALALHHATRLLREKVGEDQFMLWAPFVHLGV